MKKFVLLFCSVITLMACEGDRGPQGPPGEAGTNIMGKTVEFTVDFGNSNVFNYEFADDGIEVFESDAVLVYRSEETIPDSSGPISVWRLMPQTYYFNDGELVYNYDHTFYDLQIYLEGTTNLENLAPEYYQNQLFKIVVVPSEFANDPNNNLETYQSLINAINNQGFELKSIE